ncbi:hypothetical protein M2651_05745 [Clostridium sp. SYSU_GA19001]|uniref:hypothetical protein n=1 Tax=Clostridium caldaquaticum TaxID=2940653 RepID=UPI002077600C|nr:hypothetical protein [Clostridium caldaquaticum]MCM8710528.1 hypothetical protein [Clostridium caldaquaticum]
MKRKYIFLSKWNKHDMLCACLQLNPCCKDTKQCEEIELTLNPYDDIEEVMRERKYKRHRGALRQR